MDIFASVIGSIDEDMMQVLLKWPPFFTCFIYFYNSKSIIDCSQFLNQEFKIILKSEPSNLNIGEK